MIYERDPFGLRPLYYARHGGALHVSHALPPLLELVPHELDEESLADFIIHGFPADPQRTMFKHIARVPPAHRLTADGRIERSWSLPIRDTPLRIGAREAAETFRELLVAAVRERARGPVVVSMSGGLDSTSVAAALVHAGADVRALTAVWDELIPDQERAVSTIAAKHLRIPIDFQPCDRYQPFARRETFEPNPEPYSAAFHDFMALAAERGSVLMGGWGGDPLLATSRSYLFDLLRRGRWLRLASEAGRFALTRRQLPPLLVRTNLGLHKNRDTPPAWLLPHLHERWHAPMPATDPRTHPYRPEAFRAIHSSAWQAVFESYAQHPIEFEAPLFDTRLVEFALSLAPMPHFAGKDLLRQAMRGWLPDEVRLRPKTPLRGDPLAVVWPRLSAQWVGTIDACESLDQYVSRRKLREELSSGSQMHVRHQAHAVALAQWLRA
jgi:asparagine synthase (glutamine-hydrolysing)